MFTGLVEGQGTVTEILKERAGLRLTIMPSAECFLPADVALGDSISISGCCLTVVSIRDQGLDFQAGEETLSKTSLGSLQVGDTVNLERALAVGDRLGGHFVQGHVDGTAQVAQIDRHADWVDMWFRLPSEMCRMLVPKGSVAVDGISLTVVDAESSRFSVALIPHTLEVTTLGRRTTGDSVNIELDILGKYVARFLSGDRSASVYDFSASPDNKDDSRQKKGSS